MRKIVRSTALIFVRLFGTTLRDQVDDSVLGRAFVIGFGGRIHLFGYEGVPLRPVCIAQDGVKYWRICLGFTKAATPDYPNIVNNK
jgi:hypothetical protein